MPKKNYASNGGGSGSRRNPRFTKSVGKRSHRKHKKKLVIVSTKQVKKWNKAATNAKVSIGTNFNHQKLYRKYDVAVNVSAHHTLNGIAGEDLNNIVDSLKTFDKTGSAMQTTNFGDATLVEQGIYMKIATSGTCINNYGVPVWVDIYCFIPKKDQTSDSVLDNFAASFIDNQGADGATSTSLFAYLSQAKQVTNQWGITSHKKVCLAPGESVTIGFSKKFKYKPYIQDTHQQTYHKQFGAHQYIVRLEGVLGHDATSLAVGTSIGSVDFVLNRHITTKYAAGISTSNYDFTHPANAQAAGTVIGWPSNADNTVYATGV